MPTTNQLDARIRYMARMDMSAVLEIERDCFADNPWTASDFENCLRQQHITGMVAEIGRTVVGYMVYEVRDCTLHVLNFAVDWGCQRHGIGSRMIKKLTAQLNRTRTCILLEVRETNLAAHLFFQRCGFMAVGTLRKWYEDTDESAYQFVYELGA